MAFTGSFMCSSFKQDMLAGRMNFLFSGGNSFKMALYTSGASMTAAQTAYTATSEVSNAGTAYTTTGKVLAIASSPSMPALTTTVAWVDFDDITWTASTFTARGALIYNDTITTPVADPSVAVLDFLADKTSSAGDFTVVFPGSPADSTNAIIRIT
jgi:hypothetical protein